MRTKFAAVFAAFMLVLGFFALTASPASAGWPGGKITHAADDSGYNPPIYVRCDTGQQFSLGLGVSSWWGTGSNQTCSDVDAIYVGAGDQIKCSRRYVFTWTLFDATGWHAIGNNDDFVCYQQKD